QIREKGLTTPPASLLHQDLSLVERVLRDLANERTGHIRIDSRMQYEVLRQFGETFMPAATAKLEHYRGERPIFDLCNVDAEIARALARKVE
ncbi:ribonuclease E/G, partial [Acinetobacter baumannii]